MASTVAKVSFEYSSQGPSYIIKAIVTHEQVLHCLATSVTDREFKEPL